ncbi:MAG TPA: hypothetical protein VN868_07085, partial [Terriglobales bacterium]|nr:hypothetical protein [Terriglobales bacterium]
MAPRQPARTGRQEGVRGISRVKPGPVLRTATGGQRPRPRAKLAALPSRKSSRPGDKKAYNPLAPERVDEILRRLDQLYPEVT